ncbi:hypothetical protein C2E23DRAFT_377877 [Lenzites betulinus]|nr:hypothetical protein C2E23DRAFT_377877 [Lenzites betulinus]
MSIVVVHGPSQFHSPGHHDGSLGSNLFLDQESTHSQFPIHSHHSPLALGFHTNNKGSQSLAVFYSKWTPSPRRIPTLHKTLRPSYTSPLGSPDGSLPGTFIAAGAADNRTTQATLPPHVHKMSANDAEARLRSTPPRTSGPTLRSPRSISQRGTDRTPSLTTRCKRPIVSVHSPCDASVFRCTSQAAQSPRGPCTTTSSRTAWLRLCRAGPWQSVRVVRPMRPCRTGQRGRLCRYLPRSRPRTTSLGSKSK